ncbi:MAG: hypothetical protein ABIA63_03420 [bacterium]
MRRISTVTAITVTDNRIVFETQSGKKRIPAGIISATICSAFRESSLFKSKQCCSNELFAIKFNFFED